MIRWLPMMVSVAWGLSPGPWLEGPGPGEVTYYYNRSSHDNTTSKMQCILCISTLGSSVTVELLGTAQERVTM